MDNHSGEKYLKKKELIAYLASTFFYTNITGMVGNYRQAYLVNVLSLESNVVSRINAVCTVVCFLMSFFYAMIIDRAPKPGKSKFKPLVVAAAVPCGLLTVLLFAVPSNLPAGILTAYLCGIFIIYSAATSFGGCVNSLGVVLTPNTCERDSVLSLRGIANAIANSAPLVVVLVVGLIVGDSNESMMYFVSAVLCGVVGTVSMLLGMRVVKERVVYSSKKENPLLGFRDIIKNKYVLIVLSSEFVKAFRGIATYMGIFLAAALLGSTSKYILLGLPTGIGTFVGMLIVKLLLKKFNSKQIYICSGIYSVLVNCSAFAVGVWSFKNPENTLIQIIFFVFLFLIGLQFGASNLLPSMFQADILEDLEAKTHKRLDASLPFIIGIGSMISGTVATALAPLILYGDNSIIHYVPPINDVYQLQTMDTKTMLLAFYTVFHGIMMLLSGVPFLFYKLTGATKEKVHESVLEYRQSIAQTTTDTQQKEQ